MNRQQQIDAFLLAAHRLAVDRLRAEPHRLDQVRATLARWRQQSPASRSEPYWDRWQELLDQHDIRLLEQTVCAETDQGAALRNVSPIGSLIDPQERAALLRTARAA